MIEFLIDASKPRLIAMDRDLPSVVVYTDGVFEAREGAWGGACIGSGDCSSRSVPWLGTDPIA